MMLWAPPRAHMRVCVPKKDVKTARPVTCPPKKDVFLCSCVPMQHRMDAYLPCWLEGCRLRLANMFLDVVIRLCCDVTPTLSCPYVSLEGCPPFSCA